MSGKENETEEINSEAATVLMEKIQEEKIRGRKQDNSVKVQSIKKKASGAENYSKDAKVRKAAAQSETEDQSYRRLSHSESGEDDHGEEEKKISPITTRQNLEVVKTKENGMKSNLSKSLSHK